MYYRVTYNNQGIYQAFRNQVSFEKWKKLLRSNNINWLPKPPSYTKGFKSYFTQNGFKKFKQLVLPIFKEVLDQNQIQIDTINKLDGEIKYQDQYQIVIDEKYLNIQSKFDKVYKYILNK